MPKKSMKFRDIPQYLPSGNYSCDVAWQYLDDWHQCRPGELNLDPDFQRGHVWTDDKRIAYVEYILQGGIGSRDIHWNCKGWPLSAKGDQLVLVDGKQRMEAARKFMQNDLAVLHDLSPDGKGYIYANFTGRLSISGARFKMCVNNLETREKVLTWYCQLNDGGVVHTKEEIQKVRDMIAVERAKDQ